MGALVSLAGIAKRFDNGVEALSGFDFRVAPGEFVSLLGPSGCGKSTALRVIAGLIAPDAGTVEWPEGRPALGFVFQEPTLMPWADILSNVRLPLDIKGVSRTAGNARAAAALARVGLADFAYVFPRELSGGMKMRASIARALVAEPRLLLMDEPFAALDELTRQSLNDDLLRLAREDSMTIIFVTHSVTESVYLSDRVAVMRPRPGRIVTEIALAARMREAGLRLDPEFARDTNRVSDALKEAMA